MSRFYRRWPYGLFLVQEGRPVGLVEEQRTAHQRLSATFITSPVIPRGPRVSNLSQSFELYQLLEGNIIESESYRFSGEKYGFNVTGIQLLMKSARHFISSSVIGYGYNSGSIKYIAKELWSEFREPRWVFVKRREVDLPNKMRVNPLLTFDSPLLSTEPIQSHHQKGRLEEFGIIVIMLCFRWFIQLCRLHHDVVGSWGR